MEKDNERYIGNTEVKLEPGEWIAYDCQEWMIKERGTYGNGEIYYEISDGIIGTSFNKIDVGTRVFPYNLWTKSIVGAFKYQQDELRKASDHININWPDIHRRFVELFEQACQQGVDIEATNKVIKESDQWKNKLIEAIKCLRDQEINGVRLFRY